MMMTILPVSSPARIEIIGLVKRYQYQPVLDHLSLTIEDGDFCVVVGANGAGKTTLLRILATLVRPDAGQIRFGGELSTEMLSARRKIGYVGHQPMFYMDLTAIENLEHYARLYQLSSPDERAMEAIQSAGLMTHRQKPVRIFSRGMQQRLSIARALLHGPSILLLDEPYTGLDQEAASILDQTLRDFHCAGRVILVAAHRPQRMIPLATHVAWLKGGVISHHLPTERLSEAPILEHTIMETG